MFLYYDIVLYITAMMVTDKNTAHLQLSDSAHTATNDA